MSKVLFAIGDEEVFEFGIVLPTEFFLEDSIWFRRSGQTCEGGGGSVFLVMVVVVVVIIIRTLDGKSIL